MYSNSMVVNLEVTSASQISDTFSFPHTSYIMLCYSDDAMWMAPQLVVCWGYSVIASEPAKSIYTW